MPTAAQPHADAAERDGAPDAETALPDVERGDRLPALAEVEPPVGDDVVEPAADQAERYGPDRDVAHLAGLAAAGHPALLAEPDRDDDAQDDAQRVGTDGQRPEVPDALGGAGDAGEDHGVITGGSSGDSVGEDGADVLGDPLGAGAFGPHDRGGAVGQHAHDLGPVVDLVAAGGHLLALLDGDAEGVAGLDDAVQRAGEAAEPGVEAVEVGAQRGPVVAGGVGGHELHPDRRTLLVVEPGERRGDVGHHHLADVGAVGVAEEHQRELVAGLGGAAVETVVGAVGGGQRDVGGGVGLGEHRAEHAVVVLHGHVGDRPVRRRRADGAGGEQQRGRGDRGREGRVYARRTPAARSRVSSTRAASPAARSGASSRQRTNAEPTMTPSACRATSAA